MLGIKGFGPKKVKIIWETLQIESIGELLYAINENRLLDLKGFGEKTQQSLKQQLEYHLESSGKILYAQADHLATQFLEKLRKEIPDAKMAMVGSISRKCDIIEQLEFLTTGSEERILKFLDDDTETVLVDEQYMYQMIPVVFNYTDDAAYHYDLCRLESAPDFWQEIKSQIKEKSYDDTESVFSENDLPYYIPEYREKENLSHVAHYPSPDSIISEPAIRGCIHNHSTYSDGMNTVEEMMAASAVHGYEYVVMTDHSKSAFYANGLQEERLMQQLDEIRTLDQSRDEIDLFSGIESDILSNGSLDYPDDILGELDVIIASVHSNLKMPSEKATKRLITAIENPYTSILGHPTGRLLLSRPGYPIDHSKIIDACAANNVAIELNANPNRLDMDWRWIHEAVEKGVLISINPDAHSTAGIQDMRYGVACARKAGLPISYCLNAMDVEEFQEWMAEQHEKR